MYKKNFRDTKIKQHLRIFPSAFSIQHILKYTYGIISPASRKIYHERMGII